MSPSECADFGSSVCGSEISNMNFFLSERDVFSLLAAVLLGHTLVGGLVFVMRFKQNTIFSFEHLYGVFRLPCKVECAENGAFRLMKCRKYWQGQQKRSLGSCGCQESRSFLKVLYVSCAAAVLRSFFKNKSAEEQHFIRFEKLGMQEAALKCQSPM